MTCPWIPVVSALVVACGGKADSDRVDSATPRDASLADAGNDHASDVVPADARAEDVATGDGEPALACPPAASGCNVILGQVGGGPMTVTEQMYLAGAFYQRVVLEGTSAASPGPRQLLAIEFGFQGDRLDFVEVQCAATSCSGSDAQLVNTAGSAEATEFQVGVFLRGTFDVTFGTARLCGCFDVTTG